MSTQNFLTTIERGGRDERERASQIERIFTNGEKLAVSKLHLHSMIITNACESGFGAVGSWLGYCEAGEIEASAGRGRFQVGLQVGRLAR